MATVEFADHKTPFKYFEFHHTPLFIHSLLDDIIYSTVPHNPILKVGT